MRDVSDEYALLAVQGPRALERLGLAAGEAFTWAMGELDGVEVMVNRTGYTGEEGVELGCMADDAAELWDAILARGVAPCGLGARDTLRLEVCYPLHGNDIAPETDPISAGLGWDVCARQGLHRAARLREIKQRGPARKLVAFRDDRERDPAAGHGDRGRRRGDLRLALADARRRHRHGLRARRDERARHRARRSTSAAGAHRRSREEADLQARGVSVAASESYPEDLLYNREHDWARIEGDEAVLGITWYAHDALGELVHYEPPDAAPIEKDRSYGEVESVKAVSDVIAPLSGEVLEVNAGSSTRQRR